MSGNRNQRRNETGSDACEAVAAAHGPRVRARAWLEFDGDAFLGPGRAKLLHAIERTGSISAAARDLGVTYRTAWNWVDAMGRAVGQPMVETATGGRGGGGARLTPAGRAAIEALDRLTAGLDDWVNRMDGEIARLFRGPQ